MASKRQYDIVLLGATGYTGKWTAEHITSSLPTNIKWAVAGRNQSKLQALVDGLKSVNADRPSPAIITISNLTAAELTPLARSTRVIINTVGPYYKYSTPIVEAAAENGTHYIDATGEIPWVREIILKYEQTAKKTGAILIPESGLESAPSDLIAYIATRLVRKVWDCGVMDIVASVHELKTSGASGGTLATGLGLVDHYPSKVIKETLKNSFCISPMTLKPYTKENIYPPNAEPTTYERTGLQKFTGVWSYPRLGHLTTSLTAKPNEAVVQRSAGLNPYFYGFNFTYEEYMAVSSPIIGVLVHLAVSILMLLLAFPPTRAILKLFASYKPGEGPSKESSKNDVVELRAIAVAEQLSTPPRKAFATFRFEGGMYELTGKLLAEGAMVLLTKEASIKSKHGNGGFLTPSSLGDDYLDRLDKVGVKIDVKQIGDVGSK
ncbi:hypothetical protein PV10_03588 [Exophiala mesophila]|uniref:Saccharopine dehydrogenase NADP binding domain-containing protein n=1 Tax=Exophiala mesophila TaxID=212818 RepID=A0A0D1ZQ10_EXOME|nr:uncharacterized protein PV10_03588 [Exophiala mesophila]KIV96004.1 hypothetical protein PV10_03588 [Exophiala mesophila]